MTRTMQYVTAALMAAGILGVPQPATAQEAPAQVTIRTGFLHEPKLISTGVDFAGKFLREGGGKDKDGFYPSFEGVVAGSGWLNVGGGYRHSFFSRQLTFDGLATVSWRTYKNLQLRVEAPNVRGTRFTVGSQIQWQDLTQLQYFGRGPDSLESNRSDYRLTTLDVSAFVRYRPTRPLAFEFAAGVLRPPKVRPSAGTFDRGYPDAQQMFPDEVGLREGTQSGFNRGAFSLTFDSRDYPGYPTHGGLYRAGISLYNENIAADASFERTDLEAAHFATIFGDRLTLVGHAAVALTTSAFDRDVPSYLLPSLGGSNSVRSFAEYRFHDRNLLLVTAEMRVPVFRHIDVALFGDAGSVAARATDLDLSKTAVGFGLRVHTHDTTMARIEYAKGQEGWRLLFKMNDPFRLRRLLRRGADAPYVP